MKLIHGICSVSFAIDKYLKRINYQGIPGCDEKTLIELHRNQCFHIPFDMLDPHLGIETNLNPDYIFKKIVGGQRGGGCSQVNELFAVVLLSLGFKVERLMARPLSKDNDNPSLTHKILLAKFDDETWLCDTGFGGNGLIEPVPFVLDKEFHQPKHVVC